MLDSTALPGLVLLPFRSERPITHLLANRQHAQRREARMAFRHLRTTMLFVFLLLPLACDSRCSDRVLDVSEPIHVRELSVETAAGAVLWRFRANGLALSRIRYGHLPPNAEQLSPEGDVPPRVFFPNEKLIVRLYSADAFYFIHGTAAGPRTFCGGVSEAGDRNNLKAHERSLK